MHRLWFIFLFSLIGCAPPGYVGFDLNQETTPMETGWQYRFGDSPFNPKGEPKWSYDGSDEAWTDQVYPSWPTVETVGDTHMWQRVKLPDIANDNWHFFIGNAWKIFEVYANGERIYKFGSMDAGGRGVFYGQSWHFIPLKKEHSNSFLYFRFYSDDAYIGVYEEARIGSAASHLVWMFKADIFLIISSIIYLFMGFVALATWRNNKERINLSFGLFSLFIGAYNLCRCHFKVLLINDPTFWGNTELASLYLIPFSFGLFVDHLFGKEKLNPIRVVWMTSLAFFVYALSDVALGNETLWGSLYVFQYYFLVCIIVMLGQVSYAAFKGDREARTLFVGITAVALVGIHDLFQSIGVIKGIGVTNHVGVFVMVCCIGKVVLDRLLQTISIRKNLELASTVQDLLLPPKRDGYFNSFEYASTYEPFGRMSGDWLNYWRRSTDEIVLVFGDVVGKGPRAALAVAAIAAFIENSKNSNDTVRDCIVRVNSGLFKLFGGHITSTFGAISIHESGRVEVYNAGGTGWTHISRNEQHHFTLPSSMLGLDEKPMIGSSTIDALPGDLIFGFTDGVMEGTKLIARLVKGLAELNLDDYEMAEIFHLIQSYNQAEVMDDRTILAIRCLEPLVYKKTV